MVGNNVIKPDPDGDLVWSARSWISVSKAAGPVQLSRKMTYPFANILACVAAAGRLSELQTNQIPRLTVTDWV